MSKRFLPTMIIAILVLAAPLVQAYEAYVEEVIKDQTITRKKAFQVNAPVEIWDKVLDNPYLMGQLWEVYGFHPLYKVTRTATGIHVSDPSGIIGDIRQIDQSDHARTFFATGAFDHWAVPSFFTASGVVILTHNTDLDGVSGEITIFMRGDNGISRFVMKIFSGILNRRISNRLHCNLENITEIIHDIAHEPCKVRNSLTSPLLSDFDRVFPAAQIKPAED